MKIKKKTVTQFTDELEKLLVGRQQGDVIIVPVGEALFPDRLVPQIEIVLLDTEEGFLAYREKANPAGSIDKKSAWMLGKPAAVAGDALQWVEKMIQQKLEEESLK